MIDAVVRYLRNAGVSFRVTSYPAPEPEPKIAYKPPPGAMLVRVHVVLVDGRAALAVTPPEMVASLPALMRETGGLVLDGTSADLPAPYTGAPEPLPPLAGLFGVPLFVDLQASLVASIAFRVCCADDYVDVLYEDFAILERPRVAAFAEAGELPPHEEAQQPSAHAP